MTSKTLARQKTATDTTYLPTLTGFVCLSDLQDLYNNEIIAYSFSARNTLGLAFASLNNACMEPFISCLKTEAFVGKSLCSPQATIALAEEHIRFYNKERFQKRLGQLSPIEFRKKLAA